MSNETIESLVGLMVNGSIPLSVTVTSSTNWTQFFLTITMTLIGSFGILLLLYLPRWLGTLKAGKLSKIAKFTRKNVVMIKHTEQDLFSSAMIDQSCLRQMSEIMNEMGGQDFDLILHTPGGDIFSSLAISRLIKQYPGNIRAIVPMYSMSGGSLLALSCKELLMAPNASLGPIDPQLGNLFKYGSAKSWDHIVKFKGKKADDQSISFALIGQQYTKSIRAHLSNIIDFNLNNNQRTKLVKFLTDGTVEHGFPLTVTDLQRFGVPVYTLTNTRFLKILGKMISSNGKEGVNYYKIEKWWRKLFK